MKTLAHLIIPIIFLPLLAVAENWPLSYDSYKPDNIELVARDSISFTIRDMTTGELRQFYCPGEPVLGPGWDMTDRINQLNSQPLIDSCFDFVNIGNIPFMSYLKTGDCDRDGNTEIVGSGCFIYEYDIIEDDYVLIDSIPRSTSLVYYVDGDNDGLQENILGSDTALIIYESPDSFSLATNYIFSWPWPYGTRRAQVSDLEGDGAKELSFRQNLMSIEVLRATGDNEFEQVYSIPGPESLVDNYYDYIAADFDHDGINELITVGSRGRVLEYEYTGNDNFQFVHVDSVDYNNSFLAVGPTDMDLDGNLEFIVMNSVVWRGGYFYYFFEFQGDNHFELVYTDSLPGFTLVGGGMVLNDIDSDGVDELIVCSNGWVGIMKAMGDNLWDFIYLTNEDPPNTIFVFDTDHDGYGELLPRKGVSQGIDIMEYTPGLGYNGDTNGDCRITLSDPLRLVVFFKGYVTLNPFIEQGDVNGDCALNGLDVTYFINYFKGGPPLIEPDCYEYLKSSLIRKI